MFNRIGTSFNDLAKADVIIAMLEQPGVEYLLYGRDTLRRIRNSMWLATRTGQPRKRDDVSVVRITVKDSDEMEMLAYAVEMMKTYACLN